ETPNISSANGPMTFYVETLGSNGNNEIDYDVTVNGGSVASGTLTGDMEAMHTNLGPAPVGAVDGAFSNWLANNGGALASDGCSTIFWSNDYDPANWTAGCSDLTGSVTVTFTATDSCGNATSTGPVTFTIEDTTAPVLTTPAQDESITCVPPGT